MKLLMLVRHAQAESGPPGQADVARALTRRGTEEAAEMGRRLKRGNMAIARILASHALRAQSTADIIARELQIKVTTEPALYSAGINDYLGIIHSLDELGVDRIALVAHNPTISETADQLCAGQRIESLPTCGVAALNFDVDSWTAVTWGSGALVFVDSPGTL